MFQRRHFRADQRGLRGSETGWKRLRLIQSIILRSLQWWLVVTTPPSPSGMAIRSSASCPDPRDRGYGNGERSRRCSAGIACGFRLVNGGGSTKLGTRTFRYPQCGRTNKCGAQISPMRRTKRSCGRGAFLPAVMANVTIWTLRSAGATGDWRLTIEA